MTKCRVCGCSELESCYGGCAWIEQDLCSTCGEVIAAALDLAVFAGPPVSDPKQTMVNLAAELARMAELEPWKQTDAPKLWVPETLNIS